MGRRGLAGRRFLPVRIDLARSAGTHFEQIVLTIRAALTRAGRPLPAFDLALRRYWEATHPGEPLEEYLRRAGLGSRFGQALPQQMQSALADVAQALMLPGTIGSTVGQVTGALTSALREHRQTVRALPGCTRLADCSRPNPTWTPSPSNKPPTTKQLRGRTTPTLSLLDTGPASAARTPHGSRKRTACRTSGRRPTSTPAPATRSR
ncbi:hypothetical protein ABZ725_42780 [Streptomyces sp. NPDC006872]|uniref:hypothetical protein n=1 Tax=Streptomyces sp. NPDC006872 TaxID=3155720 RepID=UPI00340B2870